MNATCGESLPEATLEAGFCAHVIPVEFDRPRSILATGNSDFLVLDRGTSSVLHVFDTNDDGLPDSRVNVGASGGNHGLAYWEGHVYISSDTTVWRWKYELGSSSVESDAETVIFNMNADGNGGAPQGHTTRTLAFDGKGRLFISVGSNKNVDADSHRSRIRRFDLNEGNLPLDFQLGLVFADGLRNEVGLAFDRHDILWGVENGADRLVRGDLGGDIHNENPAEELNRFPEELIGADWGYPECWTEYDLGSKGLGRGTAWVWPDFLYEGITDQQCREERVPSELAMQAHSAPLGVVFYNHTSKRPDGCTGGFPASMDGYAFIAFHGSWNRDIPTGYKVVYVPMNADGRVNASEPSDLLRRASSAAQWDSGFRPVDVDFDDCGRLLLTSDGTKGKGSMVVRVAYDLDGASGACCGDTSASLNNTIPSAGSASSTQMALLTLIVLANLLLKF
jgi:glucose/arabinose dehydrogenase